MQSIQGILPALITPMRASGEIHLPELARLVDWLFDEGVHGLYVGGTTGEGMLLSLEERQILVDTVISQTKKRGPIMVHVGAVGTAEAISLAKHAQRAGADAIAAVPPFAFGRNLAGIQAHYRAIAKSCDLPLYLYNIPSLTAMHLRADDIRTMLDIPSVCGLKFSDYDLFEEIRIINLSPNLHVFHGCDETLFFGLLAGAAGGIGLTYNFIPKQILAIYDAHKSGDWKRAIDVQKRVSIMIDQFIRAANGNMVGLAKGVMHSLGFECGIAREPNPAVDPASVQHMIRIIETLRKEV